MFSRAETFKRLPNRGKLELKSGFEQAPRNYPTALDKQFSFGAQKESANFEHPIRGWQTGPCSADLSEDSHHFTIRKRIRGSQIDSPAEVLARYQPLDSPAIIQLMDPRDILPATAHFASEAHSS